MKIIFNQLAIMPASGEQKKHDKITIFESSFGETVIRVAARTWQL